MRSTPARIHERLSAGTLRRAIERPSPASEACASSNRTRVADRSDVYGRPDVYDMEYAGANNEDAQFLARLVARVRPHRVLELACGWGRVTLTLAAALPAAAIVGVDSSIEMLGTAATARDAVESSVRQRVSFVKGDMRDWPGSGDAFDAVLITCCSVSHLLTLDDRRRTWATAFRLLRPGGVFILDVRCLTSLRSPNPNASDHGPSSIWTSMPRAGARRKTHDCCGAPRPRMIRTCSAPTCA